MTIAQRVQTYLHRQGVQYRRRRHPYASRSAQAACSCGVPMQQMVKGVLVQDEAGQHVLVLIPADRQLSLFHLSQAMRRGFVLVGEDHVQAQFQDCRDGAVPAFGQAYNLETVVDDSLLRKPELFMEAGDHEELLQLSQEQFRSLTRDCVCGYFSISPQTGARWFNESLA